MEKAKKEYYHNHKKALEMEKASKEAEIAAQEDKQRLEREAAQKAIEEQKAKDKLMKAQKDEELARSTEELK